MHGQPRYNLTRLGIMSAHHDHRKYDIVVLGAIGFTGKYISEHLSDSLPTSLKWAIAGRSEQKLQQLRDHLTSRGHASDLPSRHAPTSPRAIH